MNLMNSITKHPLTVLVLLIVCVSCSSKKSSQNITPLTPTINSITIQKEIIGKLTGNKRINDSTVLKSRYTENERLVTKNYLKTLVTAIGLEVKEHDYLVPNTNPKISIVYYTGTNVYATLPATNKSNEYIILGAHYDTVKNSPGANDNATGVAMAYSVMSNLKALNFRNKNVMVIFFDQEEKGLIGSKAFAKMLKTKGYNIHSVHTVDQMGWDHDKDMAIELELPTKRLEEKYKTIAAKYNIPIHISNVDLTDHAAFRNIGYNAIGLTEEFKNKDTTPHYHKSSDTYETVDFNYLSSTTNIMYLTIKALITE